MLRQNPPRPQWCLTSLLSTDTTPCVSLYTGDETFCFSHTTLRATHPTPPPVEAPTPGKDARPPALGAPGHHAGPPRRPPCRHPGPECAPWGCGGGPGEPLRPPTRAVPWVWPPEPRRDSASAGAAGRHRGPRGATPPAAWAGHATF